MCGKRSVRVLDLHDDLVPVNGKDLRLRRQIMRYLEVTDLNNAYLRQGLLQADVLSGWWADSGCSIDGLLQAGIRASEIRRRPAE